MLIFHPFGDGNGRVMIVVLTKLLVENGFYPVILEPRKAGGHRPVIDYVGTAEMVSELKFGIDNFLRARDGRPYTWRRRDVQDAFEQMRSNKPFC